MIWEPARTPWRRTVMQTTMSFIVLVMIGAACSASSAGVEMPALIGDWEMIEGKLGVDPFPLVPGHRITVTFVEDGTFGGVAACNSYGGTYVADGEDLIVGGEVTSTAMACVEAGVDASERAFLGAIRQPLTYERSAGTLVLTGTDVVMEFSEIEPIDADGLVGVDWLLESMGVGDVLEPVGGEKATLLLDEDQNITGSTGCRRLEGEYLIDGDTVRLRTFGAVGACPDELTIQDGRVVNVLGDGFTVDIEGDVMTVESRGNEFLVYRRSG